MTLNKTMNRCGSLFSLLVITACGGSSSGGVGSTDATIGNASIPSPVNTTDVSTVVTSFDIYDPSGNPTNECASAYWEQYSGVYGGTISVFDDRLYQGVQINGSVREITQCEWDVSISLKRRYNGPEPFTRSFCVLDGVIEATPTGTPPDFTEDFLNSRGEAAQRTITYLDCAPMARSFELNLDAREPELSTPTFPKTIRMPFEDLSMQNGSGQQVNIVPSGTEFPKIFYIDYIFDGAGNITLPAATLVDPLWFTSISEIKSDLEL